MVYSSSQVLHNMALMFSIQKHMADLRLQEESKSTIALVALTHTEPIDIILSHHVSTTYWRISNQQPAHKSHHAKLTLALTL